MRKRGVWIGIGLFVLGVAGGALGVLWIRAAAYRRARMSAILDDPTLVLTVEPVLGLAALAVLLAVLLGPASIAFSLRRR